MAEEFSHKILIVDDEKSVGKSLGRIFMAEDIDFIYVESGEAALEEIKSVQNPFSIIISDQRMPGMQGTDFLAQVRIIHPDTIRFLLTAHSDMDIIISSVNKGAVHEFINKPWDNDELLELIQTWLKQYEKTLEGERLLTTVKKQNKKLYDFDTAFMETITIHDKKLAALDVEIEELEKQISGKAALSEDFSGQVEKQMEKIFIQDGKPDPGLINKLYLNCIKDLFKEFEDLANRNGFEMTQSLTGGADD